MADQIPESSRIRSFVKAQIEKQGWGPVEAAVYAYDRDYVVEEFEAVVALTRLCLDDPERRRPEHLRGHIARRVKDCVGEGFIEQMARKFGLSDERAQYIIDHQNAAMRTWEGLQGTGSE